MLSLIHEADDDEFEARYTDYLDVDQFLKFIACNVIVCNLDSFLSGSQNHYIYLEPESNRFQFCRGTWITRSVRST